MINYFWKYIKNKGNYGLLPFSKFCLSQQFCKQTLLHENEIVSFFKSTNAIVLVLGKVI